VAWLAHSLAFLSAAGASAPAVVVASVEAGVAWNGIAREEAATEIGAEAGEPERQGGVRRWAPAAPWFWVAPRGDSVLFKKFLPLMSPASAPVAEPLTTRSHPGQRGYGITAAGPCQGWDMINFD
jgi:hypothetical protein